MIYAIAMIQNMKHMNIRNKASFDCLICYCTNTYGEICNTIYSCGEMDCSKNNIYERECCKKLKCKGIHFFERSNEEKLLFDIRFSIGEFSYIYCLYRIFIIHEEIFSNNRQYDEN